METNWIKCLPAIDEELLDVVDEIEAISLEIRRLQDDQKKLLLQANEVIGGRWTIGEIRGAHRQALEVGIAA